MAAIRWFVTFTAVSKVDAALRVQLNAHSITGAASEEQTFVKQRYLECLQASVQGLQH